MRECVRTHRLGRNGPVLSRTRRADSTDRGQVAQPVFTRPYALTPEMWQNSVGKMCVLDAHQLKEAIPNGWNRFW